MPVTLESLKKAAPLKRASVTIPGLESLGKITIREFTFAEQQHYANLGKQSAIEGIAWALSTCVEGLEGVTADDINDIEPSVATRITTEIFKLSGLMPDSSEEAEGN